MEGRNIMANQMWDDIVYFHNKFKIPQSDVPSLKLDGDLMAFRTKFLEEEFREFVEAVNDNDRVKAFDALLDLVYVAMGTAYVCRFPWIQGWDTVQSANITKVRASHASESKRGSGFDVVKPEGWVAPDRELELILELYELQIKKSRLKLEETL